MMWDDDFMPGDSGFWQEPDYFLADLVSGFINKGGMELGITLFVKGMVITGTLVSEYAYLQAMSDMFAAQAKKSMVNPSKEDLKATEEMFDFTRLAEDIPLAELMQGANEVAEDDDEDNEDELDLDDEDAARFPTIRHLHLKDPMILQPQPSVSFAHSPVSVLRLRLTQVDGWMIGKVTMQDSFDDDDFIPPANQVRH